MMYDVISREWLLAIVLSRIVGHCHAEHCRNTILLPLRAEK